MDSALIVFIVFYTIYKIIELFVRQKERKFMVEKMSEVSPESLQNNINSVKFAQNDQSKSTQFLMLRLGGLVLGIGTGWLLGIHISSNLFDVRDIFYTYEINSTIIASTALCAGIAMIVVYLIERKAYKNAKSLEP